jgi:glycosyltransferase involved in cell wall biosynthesis
MDPLVSILIPAFNSQEWIADTIESALAQTWPRKEIIVVDDGSTDQTLAIAQRFASKEVSVIPQKNQGATIARNEAYSLSQGDYIQWLDADDLLARDKIALQMKAVDRGVGNRTLLSSAWGHFMYRSHRAQFVPTSLWCDLAPVEWLLRKLGDNLYMQTATWLVSRELTEAAGPWDNRFRWSDDDGEYFCRVLLASDGTHFVPDARVFYRTTSMARLTYAGPREKKMESHMLSMQSHVRYILSLEDSARVRAACLRFLQVGLLAFYPQRPDIVEELENLAGKLGGRLEMPRLRWQYAWIQKLFGWDIGRRAQILLPQLKTSLIRSWDKALYRFDPQNPSDNSAT